MTDDYQPYEFDFQSLDYAGLTEEADARVEDNAESIGEDALNNLSGYYDAESQFAPDPFEAANQQGITPEQKADLQARLIAQNDYREMEGLALRAIKSSPITQRLPLLPCCLWPKGT